MYWIFRNLLAWLLMLIFVPIYGIVDIILAIPAIWSDDEIIAWPWDVNNDRS